MDRLVLIVVAAAGCAVPARRATGIDPLSPCGSESMLPDVYPLRETTMREVDVRRQEIAAIPKVELHLHIDNSISYEGLTRIKPSVSPEEYQRTYVAPARCTDLKQFLSCVPRHLELLQSTETLQILVEDIFRQLERDAVIYAELRFAPLLHTAQGLRPESIVETVAAAMHSMITATGIEARLILCTLRHFSEADSLATVRLVEHFRGSGVAALDLAGDEAGFAIQPHAAAYTFARDRGISTTAHAGEARGPESVWQTLELLRPQRIGHGVRSAEDPKLMEHLCRARIHLEMCPSSNVQIVESIDRWSNHPIDRLYREGVSVSVSTDTRTLTRTTLRDEYGLLQQHFGWSSSDLLSTNLAAIENAFVDESTKMTLRQRLTAVRPSNGRRLRY
jgi:adenosine deaminase